MSKVPAIAATLCLALLAACGGPMTMPLPIPMRDLPGLPLDGLSEEQTALFNQGDELFDLALRPYDGLGPLYTKASCGQCHEDDARGPGAVQKMVLVDADRYTPLADQTPLRWGHTVRPLTAGGASTPITPPTNMPELKVTTRVGPSVLARGYIEALADEDLRAEAQRQTADGFVTGRLNELPYASEPNTDVRLHAYKKGDTVIGRFGLKARIATLDDFTADALLGDMGITSPMRPNELQNPDGLTDDLKPGADITLESVNARAEYLRLISIPPRKEVMGGQAAFEKARCNACHKADWKTRSDWAIPQLAGVDAPIYSDLLLHDMGKELADSLVNEDGAAGPSEWRTTPLIGLRFNRTFMHDGRTTTVADAITAHRGDGSEANASIQLFEELPEVERQALIDFVTAL